MKKIKNLNTGKDDSFECYEESVCEHCGTLDPYELLYFDGGTSWCWNCANANGGIKCPTNIKEIVEEHIRLQKEHFLKCLEKINSENYFSKLVKDWKNIK